MCDGDDMQSSVCPACTSSNVIHKITLNYNDIFYTPSQYDQKIYLCKNCSLVYVLNPLVEEAYLEYENASQISMLSLPSFSDTKKEKNGIIKDLNTSEALV